MVLFFVSCYPRCGQFSGSTDHAGRRQIDDQMSLLIQKEISYVSGADISKARLPPNVNNLDLRRFLNSRFSSEMLARRVTLNKLFLMLAGTLRHCPGCMVAMTE